MSWQRRTTCTASRDAIHQRCFRRCRSPIRHAARRIILQAMSPLRANPLGMVFTRGATIRQRMRRARKSFPLEERRRTFAHALSSHPRRLRGEQKQGWRPSARAVSALAAVHARDPYSSDKWPETREISPSVAKKEPSPPIATAGTRRGLSGRTFFSHPIGLSTIFFTEMWGGSRTTASGRSSCCS